MGLGHVRGMPCVACGRLQRLAPRADCPDCGAQNALEIGYGLEDVARLLDRPSLERREPWLWRFKELLPVDELADLPHLQVGMTPVYGAPRLAAWAGLQGLWLKDEGRAPTGSIDDRAAALAAARAEARGARVLALATRGPGAASLACFAAALGARAVLFEPGDADAFPAAPNLFGAVRLRLEAGLEETSRLCLEACARFGWYHAGGAERPYLAEGLKTAGLEVGEQLGERMPDWIAIPVGEGETLAAVHKGLREAQALGLAAAVPKVLGVQPLAAAALVRAFESGEEPGALEPEPTAALRLSVGRPRAWRKALAAVRGSGGAMIAVGEDELLEAAHETARLGAVAADPAAAAAIAGLRRAVARGIIGGGKTALALVTGSGSADGRGRQDPVPVPAELEAVEQQVRSLGLAFL